MFKNEPLTDFTIQSEQKKYLTALDVREKQIKSGTLTAWAIINGKEKKESSEVITAINPSKTSESIGKVFFADVDDSEAALNTAYESITSWSKRSVKDRSSILRKAASIMRERKFSLSALITLEVGKTWKEADADLAEAIDFCDYYADQAEILFTNTKTQEVPGEDNFYSYQPRGVSVVIAPWNFPLAIACGMTVASLVTGNPTILKPAEQSSLIAYEFAKILYEAGIPPSVFHFLPGRGETVGKNLVESALTSLICFTGSKAVGLEILKTASTQAQGQTHLKKVILELGGKNAIIVDEDADLDEAIRGILYSSFGFAGQKCSACSRLIIVGSAYEPLLERLKDAIGDIIVSEAKDPGAFLGPVIDQEAYDRIKKTISYGKESLTLLTEGKSPTNGYFIPPTLFRDVPNTSPLWRDEIFGPVVCATKVSTFEEALAVANNTQYALTGGVFSRHPKNIELAKSEFQVGNLYINRGCTGAMVERQPFGGFKMSGIGSKAGGKDYLLQFVEPRTITENTMRRGFAG
jgi:RHH-type proline utilization regulon transcriptional repressor/proline dehydrogenase/delta 1-pyrroline-5-carboxylate dehydrogenase